MATERLAQRVLRSGWQPFAAYLADGGGVGSNSMTGNYAMTPTKFSWRPELLPIIPPPAPFTAGPVQAYIATVTWSVEAMGGGPILWDEWGGGAALTAGFEIGHSYGAVGPLSIQNLWWDRFTAVPGPATNYEMVATAAPAPNNSLVISSAADGFINAIWDLADIFGGAFFLPPDGELAVVLRDNMVPRVAEQRVLVSGAYSTQPLGG